MWNFFILFFQKSLNENYLRFCLSRIQYETEEIAEKTRKVLHRLQWPISSPKKLIVEYSSQKEVLFIKC